MTVSEIVADEDSEEESVESEENSPKQNKEELNEFLMQKPDEKYSFQVKTKLMLQLMEERADDSGDGLENSFGDQCSEDETSSEEEDEDEEGSDEDEESPELPKKGRN